MSDKNIVNELLVSENSTNSRVDSPINRPLTEEQLEAVLKANQDTIYSYSESEEDSEDREESSVPEIEESVDGKE